jgi:hypothetical protein
MVRIKPCTNIDPGDIEPQFDDYDGPVPTPGTYPGYVAVMLLRKYQSGLRTGQPCLRLKLVISDGEYRGASIWHTLSWDDAKSVPWMVQFLHSLTDGSVKQKNAVRKAFFENGFDGEWDKPVAQFGKFTPGPSMTTKFKTKAGEYNAQPRFPAVVGTHTTALNRRALASVAVLAVRGATMLPHFGFGPGPPLFTPLDDGFRCRKVVHGFNRLTVCRCGR